jgi:fructose-1,6-bisphosphatase/inositol monophosphatase family enzyme
MLTYNPIAREILSTIDSISASVNRDIHEISRLQLMHSGSEDFALRTISKFANKVSGKILTNYKECDIIFNAYEASGKRKITSTQRASPKQRLIIRTVDCYKNLLRGINIFASSFVLQDLVDGKYQTNFSLINYSNGNFNNIIYATNYNNNPSVYLNGRQVKAEERTSFAISSVCFNDRAICDAKFERVVKDSFSVLVTNSIAYDTNLIADGKFHALIYKDETLMNLLPAFFVLKCLYFNTNISSADFEGNIQELEKSTSLIAAGDSMYTKLLSL